MVGRPAGIAVRLIAAKTTHQVSGPPEAQYSKVGADPAETLLYGQWPDKKDG